MRLLTLDGKDGLCLTEWSGNNIPPYAILSHTWGQDGEEVTYNDLINGTGKHKPGYVKIKYCVEQAANDGLQYSWVDTCCIDKSSSAELAEAINSMFKWYGRSQICYAYLADVSDSLRESVMGYSMEGLDSPTASIQEI